MKTRISGALSTATLAVTLAVASPGGAQEKVGVVTTVIGPVTVARASLPPEPLKFKDDVFLRDRVTTGERAFTRILLGGKVIVTARERSTLTIIETPGLSTIDLSSGRIAVAVDKARMNPGERVDIRTPNAVAGVRGTVLIVEAEANVSTVTVLRGLVHVTRRDPASGAPVGAFTPVGPHQTVSVRQNVLPPRSAPITTSRAEDLSREFAPPLQTVTSAAIVPEPEELERAHALARSNAAVRAAEWAMEGAPDLVPTPVPSIGLAPTTGLASSGLASPSTPAASASVLSSTPVPTVGTTPITTPVTATSKSIKTYSSKYDSSTSYKSGKYDKSGKR